MTLLELPDAAREKRQSLQELMTCITQSSFGKAMAMTTSCTTVGFMKSLVDV